MEEIIKELMAMDPTITREEAKEQLKEMLFWTNKHKQIEKTLN